MAILAFPCNQFGNQEPGSDAEIAEFVKKYNFGGDLTQKVDVNGPKAHPLWTWMKEQKVSNRTIYRGTISTTLLPRFLEVVLIVAPVK